MIASPRAARTRSRRRSTPRCATSSVATRSSARRSRPTRRRCSRRTPNSRMATVRGHTALFENPLVEGLERLPVHPTTLVIFGASGDLAKRKLLPAIYNLAHEGALPERFNLIGVSRGELSDEQFQQQARES